LDRPKSADCRILNGYFAPPIKWAPVVFEGLDPDQHPDFDNESHDTQQHMMLFSRALSAMAFRNSFEPKPRAEVEQKDIEVTEETAISRLPRALI
jgi:hypothetical protein